MSRSMILGHSLAAVLIAAEIVRRVGEPSIAIKVGDEMTECFECGAWMEKFSTCPVCNPDCRHE